MKRSPEIEELVRDLIDALERSDIPYLDRMISRQAGVVVIGSDPDEYMTEHDRMIDLMRESTPQGEMQIHVRADEVRGYEHGDVGWADNTGTFERGGESVEMRHTAVFLREDGEWRLVQNHASIGVPNGRLFEPLFRRASAASA
jgi:ketosteroid isomerase-like protein